MLALYNPILKNKSLFFVLLSLYAQNKALIQEVPGTQTGAYLQLYGSQAAEDFLAQNSDYQQLCNDALNKEKEFKDYAVFYATQAYEYSLLQDFIADLYSLQRGSNINDFYFLTTSENLLSEPVPMGTFGLDTNVPMPSAPLITSLPLTQETKYLNSYFSKKLLTNLSLFQNLASSKLFDAIPFDPEIKKIIYQLLTPLTPKTKDREVQTTVVYQLIKRLRENHQTGTLLQIFIPLPLITDASFLSFLGRYKENTFSFSNPLEDSSIDVEATHSLLLLDQNPFKSPYSGIKMFRYSLPSNETQREEIKQLKKTALAIYNKANTRQMPFIRPQFHTPPMSGSESENEEITTFPITLKSYLPGQERTQTEALLSISSVRQEVDKFYHDEIVRLTPLIQAIIQKEQDLLSTHYVFYNALLTDWYVMQDIIREFYRFFYPLGTNLDHFYTLRLPRDPLYDQHKTVDDFLEKELHKYGDIYDNPYLKETKLAQLTGKKDNLPIDWIINLQILSTNLSLFGNVGEKSKEECTFDYFVSNKSAIANTANALKATLKQFPLDPEKIDAYVEKLKGLANGIRTKEGGLYQIFIPKDEVDHFVYSARPFGAPHAHPNAMEAMMSKPLDNSRFKDLLDNNPISILEGDREKISSLLEAYRHNPGSIADITTLQARILLTNSFMLNPSSGVQIVRYTTATPEQKEEYEKQLKDFVASICMDALERNADLSRLTETLPAFKTIQPSATLFFENAAQLLSQKPSNSNESTEQIELQSIGSQKEEPQENEALAETSL